MTRHHRYARLAAQASGSVGAMAIQAGVSFVLQVWAARALGAEAFGRFAIIIGLNATLMAIRTGLDDSPVVLEKHDSELRGAVLLAQYVSGVGLGLVAFGVGAVTDLVSFEGSVVLGVMVGLWSLEVMARNVFMRDQRFGSLVVNDIIYAAVAVAAVLVQQILLDELTLTSFLWAIAAGGAASFVAAVVQTPPGTFDPRRCTTRGLATVLRFSSWRSAEVLVRPLSILLSRVAVAGIASTAALGNLETARLILQPIWVLTSGLGPFLLTNLVQRAVDGAKVTARQLLPVSGWLSAQVMVWTVAAVLGRDLFQGLFAGGDIVVERAAILAWGVLYAAGGFSMPAMHALVAQRRTQECFVARALDGCVGVACSLMFAIWIGTWSAPLGLGVGAVVGAILLYRRHGIEHRRFDAELVEHR